jgi:hypothetical protein
VSGNGDGDGLSISVAVGVAAASANHKGSVANTFRILIGATER